MNLDIKLLGKAIQCHGLDLVDKIKEEQQTEPSSSMMSYLDRRRPVETEEKNEMFLEDVRSFIARKSDMLFAPVQAAAETSKTDEQDNQEVADVYAIMPPLETFMSIPSSVRRDHFYNSLSKEDCVTGVVTSVLDTGLLVRLLCVDVGPARDLDGLDVMAFCPAKELPRLYAKESALDAFQQNDIVRGIVRSVNPETERIILSLHEKSIPQENTYPRVGLITEEEFPVYYRRKSEAKSKDYEDILESVMGFNNVGNIKSLVQQQGFTEVQSFTRSLSRLNIPKMEYAEGLHKWQSQKLAHQSVALGVGMFKDSKYTEAMQHFNKALQIDAENVEALVARGALFANKENFEKAVTDFRQALAINGNHTNARNYLIETLLTMGKLQEDDRHLVEACKYYQQVLEIDPNHTEAKDVLAGCQKLMAFQESSYGEGKASEKTKGKVVTHSGDSDSDSDVDVDRKSKKKSAKASPSSSILSKTAETLMQLIKEDESKGTRSKKKRKHKRSTDQSSPEKEEPRKRKKARASGRDSSSSSDSDSHERQKGKGAGMGSSPPGGKRGFGARIKDSASNYQESSLLTARLQSPTPHSSAAGFLPFSSQRFFDKSTIPGLGSPPPSDANLEYERESGGGKRFDEGRLSSPGVGGAGVEGRPALSRRDSYLMEMRKKFYEKEKGKSPSARRKHQRGRDSPSSSSSSSSRSSSSSSSSNKDTHEVTGRKRRRRKSLSPERRGRKMRSPKMKSRSKSRSRSGSDKEKSAVKTRTGVAELDMYLGDRSSSKTIMDLLGYGLKSPRKSPVGSHKFRSRSRSPVRRAKGDRRSESRSPAHRRSERSLSRSSGGIRQGRPDLRHLGRRSRSRSKSNKSGRHELQRRSRVSDELKAEENERYTTNRNRSRIPGPERDVEAHDEVKRGKQTRERDPRREPLILSDRQKARKSYTHDGSDGSGGLKGESEPQSRPFLPRVLRKPAMDDPGLAQSTISSKEYDAIMRNNRQKKDQSKTSSERDEASKRRDGNKAVNKDRKDRGDERDADTKTSKHRNQESRKSRHEDDFEEKDDLERRGYVVKRIEKNQIEVRDRGTSEKRSGSDHKERDRQDAKNDPRESRWDKKSGSRDKGKPGDKDGDRSDRKRDSRERGKSGDANRDGSDRKHGSRERGKSDDKDRDRSDRKSGSSERGKSGDKDRDRSERKSGSSERGKSGDKDRERSEGAKSGDKKTILMAHEDLEKEIERRVQERLKEEENKEKEKRERERSSGERERKDPRIALYTETKMGWSKDAYGKRYFAVKCHSLPYGYHKDKFGKTYFIGPHHETHELGESQKVSDDSPLYSNPDVDHFARKLLLSSKAEAEKDKRKDVASVSLNDEREMEMSSERKRNIPEFGRPSLSSRRGSAREDEDTADRGWRELDEKPMNKKSGRAPDSDDDRSMLEAFASRRLDRKVEDDLVADFASTSSASKDPPRGKSRWDLEDAYVDEKVDESLERKRKKMSAESLTDLEKFLTSLKQRKKQQWIAEGKIKEKE